MRLGRKTGRVTLSLGRVTRSCVEGVVAVPSPQRFLPPQLPSCVEHRLAAAAALLNSTRRRKSRLGHRDGDHPGAFFGRPAGNEPRQIGSLRGGGSGAGGEGGQGVADSSQKRRGKELRSQHPAIVRRPGPRRRGGAARCNCAPVRGGSGGGGYYG